MAEQAKPKNTRQVYTIRDVIKQNYQSLVDEQNPYKSNDKRYLSSYQLAVNAVIDNLDKEELDKVEKLVESWNKDGAPSELQLKWVFKSLI